MIDAGLLNALIKRKIVKRGTQMDVNYHKMTDGGIAKHRGLFTVDGAQATDTGFSIKLHAVDAPATMVEVGVANVNRIEGMLPEQMAEAYDLLVDGSKKKLGKRRGRPRKHPLPAY